MSLTLFFLISTVFSSTVDLDLEKLRALAETLKEYPLPANTLAESSKNYGSLYSSLIAPSYLSEFSPAVQAQLATLNAQVAELLNFHQSAFSADRLFQKVDLPSLPRRLSTAVTVQSKAVGSFDTKVLSEIFAAISVATESLTRSLDLYAEKFPAFKLKHGVSLKTLKEETNKIPSYMKFALVKDLIDAQQKPLKITTKEIFQTTADFRISAFKQHILPQIIPLDTNPVRTLLNNQIHFSDQEILALFGSAPSTRPKNTLVIVCIVLAALSAGAGGVWYFLKWRKNRSPQF